MNPGKTDFDLVIVGAGPAGLSAAVYGASEGFSTSVADEGGVGEPPLAQRAYDQAWIFGGKFAFMQKVTGLHREDDRLAVTLSGAGPVRGRAVLLAMGASHRRSASRRSRL